MDERVNLNANQSANRYKCTIKIIKPEYFNPLVINHKTVMFCANHRRRPFELIILMNFILIVSSRSLSNDIIYFPNDYDDYEIISRIAESPRIYFDDSDTKWADTTSSVKRKRLSEIKCDMYLSDITTKQLYMPLITNPPLYTYNQSICDYSSMPLIVGGDEAHAYEFPHMAAIGWTNRLIAGDILWRCGGALISERFIITAAHCVTTGTVPPDLVRLGTNNLVSSNEKPFHPVNVLIERIDAHPEFKFPNKYHDIALIKIKGMIVFQRNLRPACLWQTNTINYTSAVATGWGLTDFNAGQSDRLLKVVLNLYSNRVCRANYNETRTLKNGITAYQLCAGDMNGGRDTCMGDSGGPLQVITKSNACIFHIIGITSFGKFCGSKHPGIYTRVSMYLDWIESIVWQ